MEIKVDKGWELKKINVSLFEDYLKKWVSNRRKLFKDDLSDEQIKSFVQQFKDALSNAEHGNIDKMKELYFVALRVRQNFSVEEARRDPINGVFIWLNDEQMEEWKQALIDQGILSVN